MTDFHTLPVDEALAWIRAWTDHTWPITLQQAFAIRDALGWKPSPKNLDTSLPNSPLMEEKMVLSPGATNSA